MSGLRARPTTRGLRGLRPLVGLALALAGPSLALAGSAAREISAEVIPLGLPVGSSKLVRLAAPAVDVFVADPTVADVRPASDTLLYVYGVAPGRTDVVVLDGGGDPVASVAVTVGPDVSGLAQAAGGRVTVGTAGSLGLVTGALDDLGAALDLERAIGASGVPVSNRATYRPEAQINLRVRFAEVSRTSLRDLGVNLSALGDVGATTFGFATGLLTAGAGTLATSAFGTATGTLTTSGVDVDVLLTALEREGLVSILAEPNLTAVSGQSASFLAGGEFPVPVPLDEDTTTIEYRRFGVNLEFLPTLLPDNRIALRVRPEVSSLSNEAAVEVNGFSIPSLRVRRAETTVELASGQSFAIAGLFQRDVSDTLDKVPLVGDLPVLGALFRSSQYQRQETELVIIITPVRVVPQSDPTLVTPLGDATATSPVVRRAGFILE